MEEEYYIARDKDGVLYLYTEKPTRGSRHYNKGNGKCYHIDDELFPDLEFEHGIQKIKLKLILTMIQ